MPIAFVNAPLPSGSIRTFEHPWSFAHAFITNASFMETQAISSTPCSRRAGASSLNRGRWSAEHVGVNAPGNPNTTTVLPSKTSALVTSTHSPSSRVRKVTSGTRLPSRFSNMVWPFIGRTSRPSGSRPPLQCKVRLRARRCGALRSAERDRGGAEAAHAGQLRGTPTTGDLLEHERLPVKDPLPYVLLL